ncbi:MAG: GDP-mannose 4,6-dehydratase [Nitrospirae bacterium]|nr:GDP-mannose 4,6-dehydratase [Nitrospirota bacterium]
MANILITGAAGFIGSHLSEQLLRENARIICLDNLDTFYDPQVKRENLRPLLASKKFTFIEGDIRDLKLLTDIFVSNRIDVIVHIAARAGVRPSIIEPLLYYDVNVRGTTNLLEMARQFDVKKFVFASSSSVYGENKKVPFSEDDNVDNPVSPYAATKKAGELIAFTYHHLYGISVSCLRFFTVYGPRQRPEMAVHKFTKLIYEGKSIPVYGDGTSRRDYTYIDDIVAGIRASINTEMSYEIINLGESKTIRLSELITLIENNLQKKAIIEWLPEQPGDVPVTFANIDKARSLLGYAPCVDIQEGVERFVKWFLWREKGGSKQ